MFNVNDDDYKKFVFIQSGSGGGSSSQPFILSTTPVVDRSFMTPKAADLCSGVSVYWAYRACGGLSANDNNSTLTSKFNV